MSELKLSTLEIRVRMSAAEFPYPDTPDISKTVRQDAARPIWSGIRPRRLAGLAGLVLVVLAALFTVPVVRAKVLEFIQVGVVRIFLAEPTATPQDASSQLMPATATSASSSQPTPSYLVSVLQLNGETTLAEARSKFGYPIRMPTYPPDLGSPDHVFLQDLGTGQYVVLAWLDSENPEEVWLSLYILAPGTRLSKGPLPTVAETQVNGLPAFWTDGSYMLHVEGGYQQSRLVEGHALIWEEDGLTYRLEVDLPPEEAIRIAESLK